jgi:predicted neutral ceramidase superfamily lipid hydrolase
MKTPLILAVMSEILWWSFFMLALYSRSILNISLCYALSFFFWSHLDVCENNASIWCMTFIFPYEVRLLLLMVFRYLYIKTNLSICSGLVEMIDFIFHSCC